MTTENPYRLIVTHTHTHTHTRVHTHTHQPQQPTTTSSSTQHETTTETHPPSPVAFSSTQFFNPTGSYKDRMALAMIEGAEARGVLQSGMRVVEFTGGSTGSSLAMVCAMKGYRFHPLSSDAFAVEKLNTMRAFGADLEVVSDARGLTTTTPSLFLMAPFPSTST